MSGCLKCGDTGIMLNGLPCPDCKDLLIKKAMTRKNVATVPTQYQGVSFDKSFLPYDEQAKYGAFMEDLLKTIYADCGLYQKNYLICSRPNSGKTVWGYTLITMLADKGFYIPPIMDLVAIRDVLNYSTRDSQLSEEIQSARGLVVRVPADTQFWMLDIILYILERRVARNGFTIFLYNGKYEQLKQCDKNNKLPYIIGSGAWHTVKLEDF